MNVSTCIHLAVLLSCLVAVCAGRGVRYFPYGIDGVVVRRTVHRLGVQRCTFLVRLNYRKYKFSLMD